MNEMNFVYLVGILSFFISFCGYLCKSAANEEQSEVAAATHTSRCHQRASHQPAPAQPDDAPELMTTSPSHEQPFPQKPPPSYEETTGTLQLMPSSETVFIPSEPPHPSVHEYSGLLDSTDFLTSSACDPEFVLP